MKALTGLTPQQFDDLYERFKPVYEQAEHKRRNWRGRKRAIGGGDKPRLSLETRLFMALLYYRTYITHDFISVLVGLDESNVGRHIHRVHPALARLFAIPQRRMPLKPEEVWGLIVDATEQDSQRRPGAGYSGKQKRHTLKTQLVVNNHGSIKAVSKSVAGNIHDKKLYDQARNYVQGPGQRPLRVAQKADLGYLGSQCDLPIRKPRSRPLMLHETYFNKKHARGRIIVEHTICHLKKWHILADRYRNATGYYNLIFKNICGLRNLIAATA